MQRVGELVDKRSDVLFVNRIDLLPVDHNAGSLRIAQDGKHTLDKPILPFSWPVRQVFNRLRLPGVADKIRQQWHQGDPLVRSELQ